MSTNFTVLGGDYQDGYNDGRAGKAQATMWWGGLKKGAYEDGYKAGLKARAEAEDAAYSAGKYGEDDIFGDFTNIVGEEDDASKAKFAINFISELANKGVDAYNRSQGKAPPSSPPGTPSQGQGSPTQGPITPPSQPTSSGNFLTQMRGGAPTYVWILGGGLTLTGVVLAIKALVRR